MKTLTILFALLISITNCNAQADIESSNISVNTLVSSSFINDQEGWVVENTGSILHTTDSAKTWNTISSGNYFSKLDFIDAHIGYAISTDAVFKTTDGGNTWTTSYLNHDVLGHGEWFTDIRFKNDKEGFAISNFSESAITLDDGNS